MNPDLIAATVLFGPGAVALPVIARLWHRSNRDADAERLAFRQQYAAAPPVPVRQPTPPNPGLPTAIPAPALPAAPAETRPAVAPAPAVGEGLAPVIDLAARRHAA